MLKNKTEKNQKNHKNQQNIYKNHTSKKKVKHPEKVQIKKNVPYDTKKFRFQGIAFQRIIFYQNKPHLYFLSLSLHVTVV